MVIILDIAKDLESLYCLRPEVLLTFEWRSLGRGAEGGLIKYELVRHGLEGAIVSCPLSILVFFWSFYDNSYLAC